MRNSHVPYPRHQAALEEEGKFALGEGVVALDPSSRFCCSPKVMWVGRTLERAYREEIGEDEVLLSRHRAVRFAEYRVGWTNVEGEPHRRLLCVASCPSVPPSIGPKRS